MALSDQARISIASAFGIGTAEQQAALELVNAVNVGSSGVSSINGINGATTLAAGSNVTITPSGNTLTIASTGSGGVTTLSGLTGALTLVAGSGITITPAGSNITVASTVTAPNLKFNGTSFSNLLAFTSSPGAGGAAAVIFTVPGLLSTDSIIGVTQQIVGGSAVYALLSWNTQGNNTLTGNYVGDPGPGAVIIVVVMR